MPLPTHSIVTLRAAVRADSAAIGKLGELLMRVHHEFDHARFIAPSSDTAEGYGGYVRSQIGRANVGLIVAVRDDEVVGYAWGSVEGYDYMSLRGPAGVVNDLVVATDHRGLGIGRVLLEALIDALAAKGAHQFVLSTAFGNDAAQKLFESAGFRRTMIEMTRDLK